MAGCTYVEATNYDPDANLLQLSSCVLPVYGCLNGSAINYNPLAVPLYRVLDTPLHTTLSPWQP